MSEKSSLDTQFIKIITLLAEASIKNAARSAEKILSVTERYLSEESFSCLKEFYNLYFSQSATLNERKEDINSSVDRLIEQAQKILENGGDLSALNLKEGSEDESKRLGLSALQKKLESLITLESGLKEKLMPVLSSMQFEDATRQRVEHIVFGFVGVERFLHDPLSDKLKTLSLEIAKKLSSVEEKKIYYDVVLKEPAPLGVEKRSVIIEF